MKQYCGIFFVLRPANERTILNGFSRLVTSPYSILLCWTKDEERRIRIIEKFPVYKRVSSVRVGFELVALLGFCDVFLMKTTWFAFSDVFQLQVINPSVASVGFSKNPPNEMSERTSLVKTNAKGCSGVQARSLSVFVENCSGFV